MSENTPITVGELKKLLENVDDGKIVGTFSRDGDIGNLFRDCIYVGNKPVSLWSNCEFEPNKFCDLDPYGVLIYDN